MSKIFSLNYNFLSTDVFSKTENIYLGICHCFLKTMTEKKLNKFFPIMQLYYTKC